MPRKYDDWIKAYINEVAPRGEAPERFHFWVAAVTVAGALRRRVYIDEGTFRWYANMYVVLVGPPGTVKKSTTINVGARMLREVPNVITGADCSTWQSFVEEVAQAKDMFAEGDKPVETPADLEDALLNQKHAVTCAITLTISEFGTFFNPEDRDMVNILTELWDAKVDQAFTKRTKTQGSDVIMNPFVNMVAGTTPDWMRDNFRGRFGGWGLSSRIIFLHCDKPDRLVAYPHKLWSEKHDGIMADLTEDLKSISQLSGRFTLTKEAEDYGETWYHDHMRRKIALDAHPHHDPWLSYYLARKFDHAHKLAMVLAASRRADLLIGLSDLRDAFGRCDEIEEELSMIFKSRQSTTRAGKVNQDVWEGILKAIAAREDRRVQEHLVKGFMIQYMTGGEAKALLNHLIEAKMLLRESEPSGVWLSVGENGAA